jgi:uncharacterized membrane protein YadS
MATYEFWLKLGIVLLGARFVLADVLKLGGHQSGTRHDWNHTFAALDDFLGRLFKVTPKLISLLAIGSAVCNVSAIIAAKGAIDADDEDCQDGTECHDWLCCLGVGDLLGRARLWTYPRNP